MRCSSYWGGGVRARPRRTVAGGAGPGTSCATPGGPRAPPARAGTAVTRWPSPGGLVAFAERRARGRQHWRLPDDHRARGAPGSGDGIDVTERAGHRRRPLRVGAQVVVELLQGVRVRL